MRPRGHWVRRPYHGGAEGIHDALDTLRAATGGPTAKPRRVGEPCDRQSSGGRTARRGTGQLTVIDNALVGTASTDSTPIVRPVVLASVVIYIRDAEGHTTLSNVRRLTVMPMRDDVLFGMDFLNGAVLTVDRRIAGQGTWSLVYTGYTDRPLPPSAAPPPPTTSPTAN